MSPIGFENILTQLFQPYFYYPVILLTISCICVKILLGHYHFLGRRTRSIIYLIPLAIPVVVMSFFHPEATAKTINFEIVETIVKSNSGEVLFTKGTLSTVEILSITGILCLIALALGTAFFASMIFFGDRIATKLFHVIMLTPDEYPCLQKSVNQMAQKLNLSTPKIGMVEDIRPNAFTIGYGRRAILVFSIGLLDLLNEEELVAVASHELAHLKNHDFFFKTLSNALNIISFFNPLAYVTASAAQREREMLADESGAKLLEQPKLLAKALAKICKALQRFPKEGPLVRLTSSLFLVSPIAQRPAILATHPRVNQRIRNIAKLTSKAPSAHYNVAIALTLSLLIIFAGIATSYSLINIRTSFMQNDSPMISFHSPSDKPESSFMQNLENISILTPIPPHTVEYVTGPAPKCIHVEATIGTNVSLQIHSDALDAKYESIREGSIICVNDSGISEAVADVYNHSMIDQHPAVEDEQIEFVIAGKYEATVGNNTTFGQKDAHFSFFINNAEAPSAKLGKCWSASYKGEDAQLFNLERFPFFAFFTPCIVIVSSKISRLGARSIFVDDLVACPGSLALSMVDMT